MKIVYSQSYKKSALDDDSLSFLGGRGVEVIDEVISGPYEVYLVHNKPLDHYQLALQTRDTKFFDYQQQFSEIPIHEDALSVSLDVIKNTINSWISKYKELIIGSANFAKNKKIS